MDALKIFSLFIPYLLGFTIPLSFLLGILLSIGRLVADNEIVAIKVAGISFMRIFFSFLILGFITSLFLFILNDKIIPFFHYRYRTYIKNIYAKNISALLEPGVFLENFGNYIIYISDKKGQYLKNIFIYTVGKNEGHSRVTFAKRGEFIVDGNILKIKLEDGFRDEVGKKNNEIFRLNFKIFFMDIPIEEKQKEVIEKKAADMPLAEIREKISRLRKKGINPIELEEEFHKRISFSFSVLVFMILGFGIALKVKHKEKTINFGIAFLSAGAYYLLFIAVQTLIEYHKFSPFIGMWLPNIIVTIVGLIFFFNNAYLR